MEVREKNTTFAANADILEMNVVGLASLALSLRGTFTATIQFEGTLDGKTWFAISCTPIVSGSAVTSATAVGQWTANCAGLLSVRMRVSAFTSGAPEAVLRAVPSGGSSGSSSGGGAATVADGADVALGATTDAAVSTDTTGTVSGKLRGIVKILADIWNSTDHALRSKWVDQLDEVNDRVRAVTEGYKATYQAVVTDLALVASATDVFEIKGSSTKTVRVLGFLISGVQTTAGIINVDIVKRSTANSGGTSSAPTSVPNDSADAAATAALKAYTANPTTGTLVGKLFSRKILAPAVTSVVAGITEPILFIPNGKLGLLRGNAESLCVNLGGVTVTGGTMNVTCIWTEE